MHKSKLAGFIIDCQADEPHEAAKFWAAALGMETKAPSAEDGDKYVRLVAPREPLHIEVQAVDHESRVHLDIGADDVEAEVARLEKLGAKRIQKVNRWVVMQAPTGQRFCVVPAESEAFLSQCHVWK